MCALTKENGGIRPIAVGNSPRRLTSKAVCGNIREALSAKLFPHQMGFGVKRGAEILAHL